MAAVIPLVPPCAQDASCDGEPAKVLSLRSRLFERACEQEWTRREAERARREAERARQDASCATRLRVVE